MTSQPPREEEPLVRPEARRRKSAFRPPRGGSVAPLIPSRPPLSSPHHTPQPDDGERQDEAGNEGAPSLFPSVKRPILGSAGLSLRIDTSESVSGKRHPPAAPLSNKSADREREIERQLKRRTSPLPSDIRYRLHPNDVFSHSSQTLSLSHHRPYNGDGSSGADSMRRVSSEVYLASKRLLVRRSSFTPRHSSSTNINTILDRSPPVHHPVHSGPCHYCGHSPVRVHTLKLQLQALQSDFIRLRKRVKEKVCSSLSLSHSLSLIYSLSLPL